MKTVCVLKAGKEYGPQHVQWLAKQVPGLICISDVPVPQVETIRMPHPWASWWCKMNLFCPNLIDDDILYLDLDTVVLGDLNQLAVDKSTMLSDFYKPHMPASGLMFIKHEDKPNIWREWLKDPVGHMKRCVTREHWGDQGFLRGLFHVERWQDLHPGKVVSYKVHCQKGLPPEAVVVCFHGNPRPWQVCKPWIPR
jgi:hypothetical protein